MGELGDYYRQQEERDRELRIQSAAELQHNPERADRIFAVSAKTRLPDEVVDADLEGLESMLKRDEFDINAYRDQVNGSPVFNRFAAENPYHPTVLERDRQSLTRLERALEPIFQSWDAGWAMSEISEIQDRRLAGNTKPEDEEELKRLRGLVAGGHFGVENPFAKFLTGTAKQLPVQAWLVKESAEETMMGGMIGGSIGLAGGFGVGAVPGFFTGMGAGFAAGRTEAAFRLERGLALDEFTEMGLDPEQSKLLANGIGAVNAALESTGLGALTKRLPGFRQIQRDATGEIVAQIFRDNTFRAATKRMAFAYGEGITTEIVTEILQESTLFAGREYLKGQARLSGDMRPETMPAQPGEFWDTVKTTAIETIYGAGLIAGAGPVSQFYRESRQAYRAEKLSEAWKSVGKAAKESVTREKSPTKWEAFVDRLTESGKYDHVKIDGESFVTYFQDQGIDPDEVASRLNIDPDELAEAVEIGHDIEIPVDSYLKKIAATDYHDGLVPYLKTGDSDMSLRDAELFRKNNPEIVKKMEELAAAADEYQGDAELDRIVQDVQGQLVAAGYTSPESAGQLATILRGIGVMARRNNMDPWGLYEEVFGGVRRVTPTVQAAQQDVDVLIDPLLNRIRAHDWPEQREMFGPSLLDLINEMGGIDANDPELMAMDFDLGAQDLGVSAAKMRRWKNDGRSLASVAEVAAERGYIANRDENQLLDAIRRELSGDPVRSRLDAGDAGLRDISDHMDELAGMIEEAALDIENMTNEEIRQALSARDIFAQMESEELADLTESILNEIGLEGVTNESLLAAQARLPSISDTQDFGGVSFTDRVRIQETGDRARTRVSAQRNFRRAVQRKNVMKKLLDCVSG